MHIGQNLRGVFFSDTLVVVARRVHEKKARFLFESSNNHGVQSTIVLVIFAITDRLIQCKDFNQ